MTRARGGEGERRSRSLSGVAELLGTQERTMTETDPGTKFDL